MDQSRSLRRDFLRYFKDKGHVVVPSSSVVPHDDPTLLFTNAGMNQFKDVFLGKSVRDYRRAATSQKCIRVGGKHNDLENVGHTKRHLTFFEMLGNFSFGDYFKHEAIKFAWEAATGVFGFDPERIWPSVFTEDDEAFEMWTHYVPASRITRFGEADNFWSMGDTGPCGPCSELYYDKGPKYGPSETLKGDTGGERYLEFWNLVFMQFNRTADGVLVPLPKPSVDTGAGLERIIDLKMGVDSVFETDILRAIISEVEKVSGVRYDLQDNRSSAFRVIADHMRCLSFAIADGAQPSNVERGYVLRKVLRRAVRYGKQLNIDRPFLAELLPALMDKMGDDYPELKSANERIAEILTAEEEAFIRTLRRGGNILNQIVTEAKGHQNLISGEDAFKLKDTYGLPIEEILLLAKDSSLAVDTKRYEALELEAKERSRKVHKTVQQVVSESLFNDIPKTAFLGYDIHESHGKVVAIVVDGALVDKMKEGDEGMIILDQTPFYAEMGGQIGDTGILNNAALFQVNDCQSPFTDIIAHVGCLKKGEVKVGDKLTAKVDTERRQKIANNHTATHLLHWALHQVLGPHVKQAGSVVDANRLRFDFSHHKPLSKEEIVLIEDLVNGKIRQNQRVKSYEIPFDEAQKQPEIKQFFGEKYGSTVRVIDIDYSKELCGGTHTAAVGNIGYFRVAKESSIAAGVRRIEAVTGHEAEALARQSETVLEHLAASLKTQPQKIEERVEKLLEENRLLNQEMDHYRKEQLKGLVANLICKTEQHRSLPCIIAEVSLSPDEMRIVAEEIAKQMPSVVTVLGSAFEERGNLLVRVSDDLVAKGVNAGQMIKTIAPIIEGGGGGKAGSAQAGGKAPQMVPEALKKARELLNGSLV